MLARHLAKPLAASPLQPAAAVCLPHRRAGHSPITAHAYATQPAAGGGAVMDNALFCYQCEQTKSGTGCTTKGVCGKTPETAMLQVCAGSAAAITHVSAARSAV